MLNKIRKEKEETRRLLEEEKTIVEKRLAELGRRNSEKVDPLAFTSYKVRGDLSNVNKGTYEFLGLERFFMVGTLRDGRNVYYTRLNTPLIKSLMGEEK